MREHKWGLWTVQEFILGYIGRHRQCRVCECVETQLRREEDYTWFDSVYRHAFSRDTSKTMIPCEPTIRHLAKRYQDAKG